MAVAPKVKITSAKIGGTTVDPADIGKVVGQRVTASVSRGIEKIRPALRDLMDDVYRELYRRHGTPWAPGGGLFGPRTRTRLRERSGEGLKSIRRSIRVEGTAATRMTASITAGTMGIHETGGRVSAAGGYLAIPTVNVLTHKGNLRKPARQWGRTFIHRSKKGNLFIFQRLDRAGRRIRPLFLLRPRVYIPPRLGLRELVKEKSGYFAAKATKAMLKEMR